MAVIDSDGLDDLSSYIEFTPHPLLESSGSGTVRDKHKRALDQLRDSTKNLLSYPISKIELAIEKMKLPELPAEVTSHLDTHMTIVNFIEKLSERLKDPIGIDETPIISQIFAAVATYASQQNGAPNLPQLSILLELCIKFMAEPSMLTRPVRESFIIHPPFFNELIIILESQSNTNTDLNASNKIQSLKWRVEALKKLKVWDLEITNNPLLYRHTLNSKKLMEAVNQFIREEDELAFNYATRLLGTLTQESYTQIRSRLNVYRAPEFVQKSIDKLDDNFGVYHRSIHSSFIEFGETPVQDVEEDKKARESIIARNKPVSLSLANAQAARSNTHFGTLSDDAQALRSLLTNVHRKVMDPTFDYHEPIVSHAFAAIAHFVSEHESFQLDKVIKSIDNMLNLMMTPYMLIRQTRESFITPPAFLDELMSKLSEMGTQSDRESVHALQVKSDMLGEIDVWNLKITPDPVLYTHTLDLRELNDLLNESIHGGNDDIFGLLTNILETITTDEYIKIRVALNLDDASNSMRVRIYELDDAFGQEFVAIPGYPLMSRSHFHYLTDTPEWMPIILAMLLKVLEDAPITTIAPMLFCLGAMLFCIRSAYQAMPTQEYEAVQRIMDDFPDCRYLWGNKLMRERENFDPSLFSGKFSCLHESQLNTLEIYQEAIDMDDELRNLALGAPFNREHFLRKFLTWCEINKPSELHCYRKTRITTDTDLLHLLDHFDSMSVRRAFLNESEVLSEDEIKGRYQKLLNRAQEVITLLEDNSTRPINNDDFIRRVASMLKIIDHNIIKHILFTSTPPTLTDDTIVQYMADNPKVDGINYLCNLVIEAIKAAEDGDELYPLKYLSETQALLIKHQIALNDVGELHQHVMRGKEILETYTQEANPQIHSALTALTHNLYTAYLNHVLVHIPEQTTLDEIVDILNSVLTELENSKTNTKVQNGKEKLSYAQTLLKELKTKLEADIETLCLSPASSDEIKYALTSNFIDTPSKSIIDKTTIPNSSGGILTSSVNSKVFKPEFKKALSALLADTYPTVHDFYKKLNELYKLTSPDNNAEYDYTDFHTVLLGTQPAVPDGLMDERDALIGFIGSVRGTAIPRKPKKDRWRTAEQRHAKSGRVRKATPTDLNPDTESQNVEPLGESRNNAPKKMTDRDLRRRQAEARKQLNEIKERANNFHTPSRNTYSSYKLSIHHGLIAQIADISEAALSNPSVDTNPDFCHLLLLTIQLCDKLEGDFTPIRHYLVHRTSELENNLTNFREFIRFIRENIDIIIDTDAVKNLLFWQDTKRNVDTRKTDEIQQLRDSYIFLLKEALEQNTPNMDSIYFYLFAYGEALQQLDQRANMFERLARDFRNAMAHGRINITDSSSMPARFNLPQLRETSNGVYTLKGKLYVPNDESPSTSDTSRQSSTATFTGYGSDG